MNLTLLLLGWLAVTLIGLLPLLWLVKLSDARMPHCWDAALAPQLSNAVICPADHGAAAITTAERRIYLAGSGFEFGVPQIDS